MNPGMSAHCRHANARLLVTLEGQYCRINRLVSAHFGDARKLEIERGAYNLITLSAAVVGASGLVFDWTKDILKTAGLVAGGTQALNAYNSPAAKQKLLFKALKRLRCSKQVALVETAAVTMINDRHHAARLLSDATESIEISLLTSWIDASASQDFGTVIGNISASGNYKSPTGGSRFRSSGADPYDPKKLSAGLAKCVVE